MKTKPSKNCTKYMAMSQLTSGCFVQQKNFGINSKLKNQKSRTDLK